MSSIRKEILLRMSKLTVDCPECEDEEDEQYTCTTCWCQGGNGKIDVVEYLKGLVKRV